MLGPRYPKKPHPIPRLIYGPRTFGWFMMLWILLSALERPLSWGMGTWLIATTLVWPHLAYLISTRSWLSSSTMGAVYRNQWMDCVFYGFWIAAVKFDPWVTVLLVSASGMNTLGVGGPKQFFRGTVFLVAGVLTGGALLGWSFNPDTGLATIVLSGSMIVVYSGCVAYLTYRQARVNAVNRRTIKAASVTDSLTGVNNRRFLEQSMEADIEQMLEAHSLYERDLIAAKPAPNDLGFIMVDLDHFKRINDEHGHLAGDLALKQLADVFRNTLRKADTIVRWGGEEFLIIARYVDRASLPMVAEKIRQAVADHEYTLPDGSPLHMTCSIGFAPYPFVRRGDVELGWEKVVNIADEGLYLAKQQGRNAWVGVVPPLSDDQAVNTNETLLKELMKSRPDWVYASNPS